MDFNQLIEQEMIDLDDSLNESLLEDYDALIGDGMTVQDIAESVGMEVSELEELVEAIKKQVTSTGDISRVKDRAFRARRATLTTGMSKSDLKKRARKAKKTKKRNVGGLRKSLKKRAKAMKRRKQMGIK